MAQKPSSELAVRCTQAIVHMNKFMDICYNTVIDDLQKQAGDQKLDIRFRKKIMRYCVESYIEGYPNRAQEVINCKLL